MQTTTDLLEQLDSMLGQWEAGLDPASDADFSAPLPGTNWSLKDVLAHLTAWQDVSVARLEAARDGRHPVYPDWLEGGDPDSEPETEAYNGRIHAAHKDEPWETVRRSWSDTYRRLLVLAKRLPPSVLRDPTRYPWMKGMPLNAVLEGTLGHHAEHLPHLLAAGR
jgi:hypothetical protein